MFFKSRNKIGRFQIILALTALLLQIWITFEVCRLAFIELLKRLG